MKKALITILTAALIVVCMSALFACKKYDYKIGVQKGTTAEFYVKGNSDMKLDGYPNIECKSFDNSGLAVQAMLDGKVDYVIVDNEPAKQLVGKIGGVKLIDIPLTTEKYAYGVDKNQPALLEEVNSLIEEIKGNGKLEKIIEKYGRVQFDDEGNVTGDEEIKGISSAILGASEEQLIVATNAEFAPFEYKRGDEFIGIDIEIAKLLADKLEQELVIKNMDFDSVCLSVGKNGVDIAMAGLSVTETREQTVNFSDAYYEGAYQVLVVKKGETKFEGCKTKEDVEKLLQAKGKK